jgi:hypothetical protein
MALALTPLWPAGHLPLKGGDPAMSATKIISPREGEITGRPEGGVTERTQEGCHHG